MATPLKTGDENDIVEFYETGVTAREVAQRFKTSIDRVRRILQERGVHVRSTWETRGGAWEPPDLRDFLSAFDGGKSVFALSKVYGTQRQAVSRVLLDNGRVLRSKSDAERLKWSQMSESKRKAQVRAANADVRGRHKSREFRLKQAATRALRRHKASPKEIAFAAMLIDRGLVPQMQVAVDVYNADLTIAPIAVEIHASGYLRSNGSSRDLKRVLKFLDARWSMLVICDYSGPVGEGAANYAVAWCQELRRNPPAIGQYRVIDGAGQLTASGGLEGDGITCVFTRSDRKSPTVCMYARPRE